MPALKARRVLQVSRDCRGNREIRDYPVNLVRQGNLVRQESLVLRDRRDLPDRKDQKAIQVIQPTFLRPPPSF